MKALFTVFFGVTGSAFCVIGVLAILALNVAGIGVLSMGMFLLFLAAHFAGVRI